MHQTHLRTDIQHALKDFADGELYKDGFSDREDNPLSVPNEIFFSEPQEVNLNAVYDTKNSRYTVRGLIHILNRYKFTIAENTPIEQEVALDPELLGQVFENLLAAYNPETGTTARKQTGSFYTPFSPSNHRSWKSFNPANPDSDNQRCSITSSLFRSSGAICL